ncbi:MAG: alpha/beta hydrolase [Lachnospiraceae bacterium]|nr:alpha/beta hydrolase [Lachnospiraceae bacterium]
MHGDADDIAPLSYSRKAVKTYSSADLKVIKGAGHGFDGAADDEAVRYILSYLKKVCKS